MEFSSVNTIWVLVGAALVFFMQAGFAILESGLTRAKNAGNIIMKILMDFCIGTPVYWIIGFGIMFGSTSPLFGSIDLFTLGSYADVLPSGVPKYAYVIFQTVFCATAATIVSGAMAERTKFSAYCIYSFLISLIVYPVSGHWIWGGGWLAQLGFHDFAGSTAVHMVGGCAALIGAAFLGPRIGKFTKDGKPKAILGHNLTMAALGVFMFTAGPVLISLFTNDVDVMAESMSIIRFLVPFWFCYICVNVYPCTLRGVGDALIPMLIICVGTCILRVLWVFGAGAVHPGLYTTLTSYPLSWTITSLAFLVYYYRFSAMRKLNKLIEE